MGTDTPRATKVRTDAKKEIARLPRDLQVAVLAEIARLVADPMHADTEAVVGSPPARRSRVREHRILYVATETELVVLDVLPRGEAYGKRSLERLKVLAKSFK